MTRYVLVLAICVVVSSVRSLPAQTVSSSYLGFDSNEYPGDASLKTLHQTFSYAGYWLNNPPGAPTNHWLGHRAAVESAGFGFLVLFNGRLYAQLKSIGNAQKLGSADAQSAVTTAQREGFKPGTIIFLDQEQGGRMLPEQKAYIYAWVDGLIAAGFRAGIYCSGMISNDSEKIVTAQDIRATAAGRQITYWAINDGCPPSPGCVLPQHPPIPTQSGIDFAEVWQFAQSPRRKDVAARCTNYNHNGNCYAPGLPGVYVDLDAATSLDPSHGRTH